MIPVFITLLIIWVVMWGFFKFMYPKPPKAFMPKAGDVLIPRPCSYCGHTLAEYRGVLEPKPDSDITSEQQDEIEALQQALQSNENSDFDEHTLARLSRMQKKIAKVAQAERKQRIFNQKQQIKALNSWFFCNYEHQAAFHALENRATTSNTDLETNELQKTIDLQTS